MALGTPSGCINHPTVEAISRCKQCGKPYCNTCRVQGPTGSFCSEACKSTHEQFTQRAQKLDHMSRGSGMFLKFYWLGKKIFIIAFLALLVGIGVHFMGREVPIVSNLIRQILGN